jgi:tRNA-dihydrouridine synthase B
MAEASLRIIDWKQPDFIDINFGCPVNKVVSRNGGSALLKDCPVLASVAGGIVRGVGDQVPVTAKIRIGWDMQSINAPEICRILEGEGIQAVAIHGRTRSQGYSGEADWDTIAECAAAVSIPVVGNGDIRSATDIERRRRESGVNGVMIGRAAMSHPWIFRQARHYFETGEELPEATPQERWSLILRHCRMALEWGRYGDERHTLQSMRSRLMAYSRGLRNGRNLRTRFSTVESVTELEDIAAEYLAWFDQQQMEQVTASV